MLKVEEFSTVTEVEIEAGNLRIKDDLFWEPSDVIEEVTQYVGTINEYEKNNTQCGLYDKLSRRLIHPRNHRAQINGKHTLCVYLRHVAHGTSFAHLQGEFAIGLSTTCETVKEVANIVVDEGLSEQPEEVTETLHHECYSEGTPSS
ncbi:hypothetical protein Q1695_012460 [Nippostrongylus brasiliensis]|nr:hypothetical protein Q1695_012460 [Nippostrongylus brasiliensis]